MKFLEKLSKDTRKKEIVEFIKPFRIRFKKKRLILKSCLMEKLLLIMDVVMEEDRYLWH